MRIALFEYRLVRHNPVGGFHWQLVNGLADEHEFVVFAVECDNPRPDRIQFVRVPVPKRPLVLLFIAYRIVAPIVYLWWRLRGNAKPDAVQTVESNAPFRGDFLEAHFCHGAFLAKHWKNIKGRGLRSVLRYLDHKIHAIFEPRAYRRAGKIVGPSRGLIAEIVERFPKIKDKILPLTDPIDTQRFAPPANFDRAGKRAELGWDDEKIVLIFTALGQFERKGLPLVIGALKQLDDPQIVLDVIGGEPDYLRGWQDRVDELGLTDRVKFRGMTKDVRPFLWAADALAFPSSYETFSLTTYESAAAGLPLIVSQLHGVEELLRDGKNGLLVERNETSIAAAIAKLAAMSRAQRQHMGEEARRDAGRYDLSHYLARWRVAYDDFAAERLGSRAAMDHGRI